VRQHPASVASSNCRDLSEAATGEAVGRDDVSSKKRAGRQVRKRLRAEAWAAVRKNARLIAGFLAVYLTVCAVAIALYHW
jgi:hypothetical protein